MPKGAAPKVQFAPIAMKRQALYIAGDGGDGGGRAQASWLQRVGLSRALTLVTKRTATKREIYAISIPPLTCKVAPVM